MRSFLRPPPASLFLRLTHRQRLVRRQAHHPPAVPSGTASCICEPGPLRPWGFPPRSGFWPVLPRFQQRSASPRGLGAAAGRYCRNFAQQEYQIAVVVLPRCRPTRWRPRSCHRSSRLSEESDGNHQERPTVRRDVEKESQDRQTLRRDRGSGLRIAGVHRNARIPGEA